MRRTLGFEGLESRELKTTLATEPTADTTGLEVPDATCGTASDEIGIADEATQGSNVVKIRPLKRLKDMVG